MANGTFDSALHREVELYNRVNNNDPANSAFILVILAASGLEVDGTLRTYATLAAVLAASNNEATNSVRKTLTDADLAVYTVDTANHKIELPFPSPQTYTTPAAGDSWRKLLVCYDSDTTAGTDANVEPVFYIDTLITGAAVVPNGTNITIAFPDGVFIAN